MTGNFMDNTGNYIEYKELIVELYADGATGVSSSQITLANKTTDPLGDIFEYSNGSPKINDILYQVGEFGLVKEILLSPDRIRIDITGGENLIANGPAELLSSTQLTKKRAESLIKEKMALIDRFTGQFFNARSGIFTVNGNNTPLLQLSCAIILVEKIVINSTGTILLPGDDQDFVAFNGRQAPADDRYNPRIKLNIGRGRDSIYSGYTSNKVFVRDTLTEIHGTFGFLEADGSTPEPIKRAMKLLIFKDMNNPITKYGANGVANAGPLRRKKVDLHEEEFFASPTSKRDEQNHVVTGISEVDSLLSQYKAPIKISGSIPKFSGGYDV